MLEGLFSCALLLQSTSGSLTPIVFRETIPDNGSDD